MQNVQTESGVPDFYLGQSEGVKLTAAKFEPNGLVVSFSDRSKELTFPWYWVRDHGIDAKSLNPSTLQRETNSFELDLDEAARSITFDAEKQLIDITWNNGPSTTISAYMLASVKDLMPGRHQLAPQKPRIFWDKHSPLEALPTVAFDAVMDGDDGLRNWLENIWIYGFSMVDSVPSTPEATKTLAERIGHLHETIFGRMWPLSSELTDHGDTAYTTEYLEPHTDNTYYEQAAGLQMFNCLRFDGKGGESIQVDGFAIANRIKDEDPEAYHTLSTVTVPGHYIEPGVHLRAERTPFRHNDKGELIQVSFNNYDRAPFILPDEQMRKFHHAYGLFHKHANDQDNWIKVKLQPGLTLIFDNWRNLHGRMGYVGKREFYGCYIGKAVWESKLRVLQAI